MKNTESKRPLSGDPDAWEKWEPFKTGDGSTELRPVESPPKPESPSLRNVKEGPDDAVFFGLIKGLMSGVGILAILVFLHWVLR